MSEQDVRYWTSAWQPAQEQPRAASPRAGGRLLLITGDDEVERAVPAGTDVVRVAADADPAGLARLVRDGGPPDRILIHRTPGEAPDPEREFFLLFHLTQALMREKPRHDIALIHAHVEGGAPRPEYAAVEAFARVVRLEKPSFRFRGVALAPSEGVSALLAEFEHTDDEETAVRYEGGRRFVRRLRPLPAQPEPETGAVPVRTGGVYLITGGLGDLGLVFARELTRHTPVNLVLTGRRPLDAAAQRSVTELERNGSRIRYVRADVSTPEGVAAVVEETRSAFGRRQTRGVIHAAGVTRDSFLLKKTAEEAASVLAAKVRGTRLLDEALRAEPLDFFVLFSSLAASLGNLGQADYAYANGYLDHYARWRETQRVRGQRSGRSLSIGWPQWAASATMHDDATQQRARAALGLHPLTTAEGVTAFTAALACDTPQVVIIKGEPRTWPLLSAGPSGQAAAPAGAGSLEGSAPTAAPGAASAPSALTGSGLPVGVPVPAAAGNPAHPAPGNEAALRGRTREYLRGLVARFTKLPVSEIRTDASFGRYGVESIMIIAMTQEMEGELGPLGKTLFFEYDSVDELADHLVDVKAAELRAHLGLSAAAPEPQPEEPLANGLSGKWALLQARTRARSRREEAPAPPPEAEAEADIAVIGVSGRYPQAADLDAFWRNLRDGTDSVTEIPARRWDHTPYFDSEKGKPGATYSRWGGFVDGVELFDPLFFSISPVEAEYLDPQERLFLETSWQVIEDAGYAPGSLAGRKVGVFAGVMFGLYQLLATDKHGGWLNGNSSYASVANRVSYFFDFHGPSLTIDSMCSSSLVAVHQACASIRRGESELAIAGGVNLMVHPAKYVQLSQGNFLSTDGRCRSFGAGGDGYVPGEGVGAVLLKSLRQARADGDQVHAVIKASAVNAGGRTSGYSVPNPQAQAALITEALDAARIDPRSISYVEAHGTGTALGDPIEITGLTKAYRRATQDRQFCAIGSVKSNIGHLESAAGIAALTKVILQMRHRQLVPSLHAATLNPLIDFDETPFYVQRELSEWHPPAGGGPRRAAISAFGAGGTNAHLIVEEPETTAEATRPADGEHVFLLSARTEDRLAAYARQLLAYLSPPPPPAGTDAPDAARIAAEVRETVAEMLALPPSEIDGDEAYADLGIDAYGLAACHERLQERLGVALPDDLLRLAPSPARTAAHLAPATSPEPLAVDLAALAFTLQTGREAMAERLAVTAADLAGLRRGLAAYLDGNAADAPGVRHGGTAAYDQRLHPLLSHDVTRTYTRQLLAEGRQAEAAELWVMGADVDWAAGWEGADRPRRLSLPTYPFAREVHWIVPVGPDDPLVPAPNAPVPVAREPEPEPVVAPSASSASSAYDDVLAGLKRDFAAALNIPEERLRPQTPFDNYGIDSIRITQLNKILERRYPGLPASLLFTYKTLDEVARYLTTTTHREEAAAPSPTASVGDIAIIGLSGRYPRAATLAEFGANLAAGRDCVTEIPAERWDHRDYPEIACRWGGFIEDARAFDPGFFSLSPNNAAYMDPQERLFVQSVWHCLEDAGYTPEALADPDAGDRRGNVAVYAGVSFNEYGLFGAADLAAGKDVPIDAQLYSVANRISYLLNLRGPSLVVDTACSSSAYAIHLACQALRNGDCDVAIAGGVNLSLHPSKYLTLNMFNFLSSDGHCKSFGAGGNGYVPGEGVGTVLLKPLAAAEGDGDHIYAVIKGSAVNHGGRTHGYTVPNPVAQAEVVRAALDRAGVAPGTISYVEAHGTGTSLGDTIEIEALATAFGTAVGESAACAIGSVKSNIGHLEAAAGISGVTKILLQFQTRQLFPSRLNSDRLNPEIDFERTPFRVQLEAAPWEPPAGQPRRAGISSFGVGGVNVHLVLEEYAASPPERPAAAGGPQLIPLSARTPQALLRYAAELHAFLQRDVPGLPDLADMAFTLRTGRRALASRAAFVAADHAELAGLLKAYIDAEGQVAEPADELARRWLAGEDLPPLTAGRRVSLPGYPFEKETYWLYEAPVRGGRAKADGPAPAQAVAEPAAADDGADVAFLERLAEAFDNERPELLTAYVQGQFAELLGFTEGRLPDPDEGFFEMGMDSITSTQAHNLLEKLFGKELDLQLFFNYPSIREVSAYILGLLGDADGPAPEPEPAQPEEPAPTWLFTREWQERDTTPEGAGEGAGGGTVLLFDTGDRLRAALAALPADRRPERVILVRPGPPDSGCRATGEDTYELDPAAWSGYTTLFQALAERGITVDRAVHLWSFRSTDLDHGVYSLTGLSQAALAAQPRQRLTLLYAFAGQSGTAAPEHRGVGGFIRAVRLDNPLLAFKTVEFTRPNLSKARVATALMAEFGEPEQDVEVRHDGTRRWVRGVRPVPAAEIEATEQRFTTGGVYLITGGPRGLAGLFGRYLSSEHNARVVLAGRREPDADALAELASYGADYLRADVGDADAVTALVAEVKARHGRINGVIHAAGALRDGSIQNKTREEMAEVFRAKVSGTRHLDEALKDEPLECFILFSSLAAVMGNFGQSDYCFANAYLDAFADQRERQRQRGERAGHTVSVNWSFWRSGGMETSDAILTWMRNRLGTVVLDGDDGWHALRTGIGLAHPQVVTVKGDIDKITRMLGVPETDIATTLPLEPPTHVTGTDALDALDALDGMDGQDLVALLQKEIDMTTMNEGADVS